MTRKNEPAAWGAAGSDRDAFCLAATHSENSPNPNVAQERGDLLSAALALAALDLKPVPMLAARKQPACKGWRESTSLDGDAIAAMFAAARHADALGIATGGGVFVVDLDRNHKDAADGVAAFADLIARHGAGETLALGPRVTTPGGGVHLYFASPQENWQSGRRVRNRTALAPGVDVRGEGGVAMVPPSARDGVAYCWAPDPWCQALTMGPAWLLDLVAPDEPPPRPLAALKPFSGDLHPYARAALQRECAAVAGCGNGARNATLFKAAASLGALAAGGALSAQAVADALLDAAQACGLIADDGRAAVEATIASGLRRGLTRPRSIPRKRCGP